MSEKEFNLGRPVHRVIEAPTMRPDGSILQKPGLDDATGTYYEPSVSYPAVDDKPTREECIHHEKALAEVVEDFPFASKDDYVLWLAGLLTSVARPAIQGPTPLFLVEADQAATGKTRLAHVAACIAGERNVPSMSLPHDEDEVRKLITAILCHGQTFVLLDHVGRMDSQALSSVLTSTTWADRRPGTSQLIEAHNRAVWWATGTNVAVGGDMTRRVLRIHLKAANESPGTRSDFRHPLLQLRHPDLLAWVAHERARLVVSALSILRGYVVADRPRRRGASVLGGFESWTHLIAGAIEWLGVADPFPTRAAGHG